jgi:uncharacterized membrane protein
MIFDITVWTAVVWMMFMVFALDTNNYRSMFVFKVLPFAISVILAVAWAGERGYLINTGG